MVSKIVTLFLIGGIAILSGCQSGVSSKETNITPAGVHKVLLEEALQTSQYTYLHVKDNGTDQWLAVPSMTAKTGETYYYKGGIQMTKFESKELHRVFETVTLLERVATNAADLDVEKPTEKSTAYTDNSSSSATDSGSSQYQRKQTPPEKKEIKVAAAKGGITIAELFSKKESWAGKTVKIKGQVTKYTPAVMNKNWIHIQDGTDYNGKFDLTITSDNEVKVGDEVTFEGKISLDKDLGYGYFFEVIMEDATVK